MKSVNSLLDAVRDMVRGLMNHIAKLLNAVSGGKITPNAVTITGLIMHMPIAVLIAKGYFGYAAIGLVVFGLFDSLDGALARLQGKASSAGMLLDAVTDRIKEVLLYMGIGYIFTYYYGSYSAEIGSWFFAVIVGAIGGSLLVSYTKAKGETVIAGKGLSTTEVNRLFQDGFMRYELRMFALILGLLLGIPGLMTAVIFIAALSWLTVFERLIKITRKLS